MIPVCCLAHGLSLAVAFSGAFRRIACCNLYRHTVAFCFSALLIKFAYIGPIYIYTIISLKSVCLSQLTNCRSQLLLDRLGRCLKLFVSTESTSCHEFTSQFGLEFFICEKHSKPQENRAASDQPLSPAERAVTVGCHRPIE